MTTRLTPFGLALLLVACTGDSGDDDGDGSSVDLGPLLVVDEALVTSFVDTLTTALPTCVPGGSADTGAGGAPPPAGVGSDGPCGGSLDVQYDHGDGDSSYVLTFASFCMSSDEGDVVIDGVVRGFEDGTPSDDGPVVDVLTIDTDGALQVTHDGDDFDVTLQGFRTAYGDPAPWQPNTPTADAPDITTIQRLTFEPREGSAPTYAAVDVRIERVGATPEVTVTDGALVIGDLGHVELTTLAGDPLVIDLLDPLSGTIVASGADGTEAHVRSTGASSLDVSFEVNGAVMDGGVDCSATMPLLTQAAGAVWQALPLY